MDQRVLGNDTLCLPDHITRSGEAESVRCKVLQVEATLRLSIVLPQPPDSSQFPGTVSMHSEVVLQPRYLVAIALARSL